MLPFPHTQIVKENSIEGITHDVLFSDKFGGALLSPPPLALFHESYIHMLALI